MLKGKGLRYGVGLAVIIMLLFLANLLVGSVSIPAEEVVRILMGDEASKASWRFIVWQSRLPQALTALLCGASLAVCGLLLQTVLKNPLAGPSILGIDAGASLGVALVMLAFGGSITTAAFSISGFLSVMLGAFVGAMAIMALILFFSTLIRSSVMLLITGIMVGYIASSAISLLNFFATEEGVQSYLVWGLYNVLLFLPLILLGKSKRYKDAPLAWKQLPQMLLTFVLVTIGWIIFRAPSLADGWNVGCTICSGTLWSVPYMLPMQEMLFMAIGILVMMGMEWLQRNEDHGLVLERMKSRVLRYAIYLVLITMMLWKSDPGDAFIYFQF